MRISGISSAGTSRSDAARSSTHTRRRFALAGPSHAFDARIDAARGDLADLRLADRLFASHYAAAALRSAVSAATLTGADGRAVSEVLAGETFEVLELAGGRAWGVATADGSVGHVDAALLAAPIVPTHIVCARSTAADDGMLPMGARLLGTEQGKRLRLAAGGSVALADVRPLSAPVADFVALAEALVGVPALAGGRSGAGVDGTGLVFLTLSLAGIRAPRFVDLQAAQLGHAIGDAAPLLRGDLLFFDDHVAIAADQNHAVHVGATAVERVSVAAIAGCGGIRGRRRLP